MLEILAHRWLRIPYTLHAHSNQKPARPIATVLFIHGIGNSGAAWENIVREMPEDVHVITIDLLGFGNSPRPEWAIYDAKTQARSVIATLLRLRAHQPLIVVGHSLGALVAVELARRYPLLVRSLVLASPPFYRVEAKNNQKLPSSDKMRRDIYRLVKKRPDQLIQITSLAIKLGLLSKTFSLTAENTPIYMNAFEASILNQTSLRDAEKLKQPIRILYGRLDPVVRARNLTYLARLNKNVVLIPVLASHEVMGIFAVKVASEVNAVIAETVGKKHLS